MSSRYRSHVDTSVESTQSKIEALKLDLEEESEIRLDWERQLAKAKSEVIHWKNKYDFEAEDHSKELDDVRKRYTARLQEKDDHIESLNTKIRNLEKHKNHFMSENKEMVLMLDKTNEKVLDHNKRVKELERALATCRSSLDDAKTMLENCQYELRQKTASHQRMANEMDKTREQRDFLSKECQKLVNGLNEAEHAINEMAHHIKDLESRIRRLVHERQEIISSCKCR